MSHLVLSRRYRPQTFAELVGQDHVSRTLANAITSDRVGHAYLFVGPRGTGKTTTARIFAKALNCEKGPTPTPCGTCDSCVSVAAGTDLDVVEMDAASNNGVDDVRALRDSVGYRPARSRFRVWIVDEVHMLSLPAFNAFLKTLEEPPPQAKFLFCTTEAHKLPETFSSRVQRLEFRCIDEAPMAERLRGLAAREGVAVEEGVVERIAAGALGGLRDAESLLEQLLSSAGGGRVTASDLDAVIGRAPADRVRSVLDAVAAGDAGAALDAAGACLALGGKPEVVLDQWVEQLRSRLVEAARAKAGPAAVGAASAEGDAPRLGLPRILASIDLLLEKRRHLRDGADGRLVVEVAAVELARLPSARDLDRLLDSLGALGSTPTPASTGRASPPAATPPSGAPPPRTSPFSGSRAGPTTAARVPSASLSPDATRAASAAGRGDTPESAAAVAERVEPVRLSAPLSFETVVERWEDVLKAAQRDRRLASALARARPVAVDADSIVVALGEAESYARGVLRDRAGQEGFRAATREVFGVALRPTLAGEGVGPPAGTAVLAAPAGVASARPAGAPPSADAPSAPAGSARPDADDVRRHPDVKAVLDGFGARLLAVQKVAPAGAPAAAAAATAPGADEASPGAERGA